MPPIINAIAHEHYKLVKYLCDYGAKLEGYIFNYNQSIIDFAILHGNYKISQEIYSRISNKKLKSAKEYEELARKLLVRYVHYGIFLDGIICGTREEDISDYQTKPRSEAESDDEDCCGCCAFGTSDPNRDSRPERKTLPEKVELERSQLNIDESDKENHCKFGESESESDRKMSKLPR